MKVAAENVARVVTLYKTSVAPVLQVGGTILCLVIFVSLLFTPLTLSGLVWFCIILSCLLSPIFFSRFALCLNQVSCGDDCFTPVEVWFPV